MKKFIFFLLLIPFLAHEAKAENFSQWNTGIDSAIAFYIDKVNPDSIQAYMQALENMGTRFCLADNRRDVAVWIMNKFIGFGYPDTHLDSFMLNRTWQGVFYETWQYNVVSTLTGYARPDEVYILGGHHDAIISQPGNPFNSSPGADDNGSGVAAALEVARILKQYNYNSEATIRFITFAAEELGLHGSWHYATSAASQNMNIKMMINNDMISHTNKPQNEWAIKLNKYPNSIWVSNLAAYIADQFTVLETVDLTHSSANTDSWPFYDKGYHAIFLHENEFCPYYHSVNDLVLNTNKFYAAEMVKVSLGMLIHENGTGLNLNISELEKQSTSRLFPSFPNPFSSITTIKYSLFNPGWISLQVFDVSNRLVSILHEGWQESGSHNIAFNPAHLPEGIYFCRLQTANEISVVKLVVIDK